MAEKNPKTTETEQQRPEGARPPSRIISVENEEQRKALEQRRQVDRARGLTRELRVRAIKQAQELMSLPADDPWALNAVLTLDHLARGRKAVQRFDRVRRRLTAAKDKK